MTPQSGQISFSSLRTEIMQASSGQLRLRADAGNRMGYGSDTNVKISNLYRCYGAVVSGGNTTDKFGTNYGYSTAASIGSVDDSNVMSGVTLDAWYTTSFGQEFVYFSYPMTNGFGVDNMLRVCTSNNASHSPYGYNSANINAGTSSVDPPYFYYDGATMPDTGSSVSVGLQFGANNSGGGGGGGGGGGCCFSNDTEITMADHTIKLINKIQVGDLILSYNPETQQNETNEVSEIITRVNRIMYEFHLENGTKIKGSQDHPFYVVGKGYCSMNPTMTMDGYKSLTNVQTIEIGDKLVDKDKNEIVLQDIVSIDLFDTVYTFNNKYKTSPNFYANGVLVY